MPSLFACKDESVMCNYPRTLGDPTADSITIALVNLNGEWHYQQQPSADAAQLQLALVIQGSRTQCNVQRDTMPLHRALVIDPPTKQQGSWPTSAIAFV